MRVEIEYDPAHNAYDIYVVSEAVLSTERTIMRYDADGHHEWEVITQGEAVAPTVTIPAEVFTKLFDTMSQYIRDYGQPDQLIVEAWRSERARVDKFIEHTLRTVE